MLVLSSCGIFAVNHDRLSNGNEGGSDDEITYIPPEYPIISETDYEKKASERVNALPDANLNGQGIVIAVEKETGDIFNDEAGMYVDAVNYRNSLVSSKYNVNLITIQKNAIDIHTDIRIAKMNGDYFADIAVLGANYLGAYNSLGYIINMNGLSNVDYTKPYYNQEGIDQLSVGNIIYGVVGSATETPDQYGCLYFNKTLAEKYGITLDYRQIYDNGFTWDAYFEYLNAVDEDGIAFVSSYDDSSIALCSYMGANKTFLSKENGYFVQDYINDTTRTILSNVKSLLSKRTSSINKTVITQNASGANVESVVKLSGFDVFVSGDALTAFGNVGNMTSLQNAGFSWEILPIPLIDGQERYASSTPATVPILSVLSSSPNISVCGYIVEGFFAVSEDYFKGVFIKNAMKHYTTGIYTPDMLELVFENPVYDFVYAFSSASDALKAGTSSVFLKALTGKNDISTYYTSKIKTNLEKFLNSFKT